MSFTKTIYQTIVITQLLILQPKSQLATVSAVLSTTEAQ